MPINYQIAADVIDIQTDTPKKDDKFFIDTNVWFWMTYTQASNSARHYQITNYPSYVNSILDAGGSVYQNGLSFAELAHLIEKTELDIFNFNNRTHGAEEIRVKEFRHNHPREREKVTDEIEAAWIQVKSLAEPLDVTVDESIADTALERIKTQKVDGYDLFILELMFRHNILQIITDDGDFVTIPGIKVFTSNRRVIYAAQQQEKILTRWDTQAQPILNQT